jgi:hypothetical protein
LRFVPKSGRQLAIYGFETALEKAAADAGRFPLENMQNSKTIPPIVCNPESFCHGRLPIVLPHAEKTLLNPAGAVRVLNLRSC